MLPVRWPGKNFYIPYLWLWYPSPVQWYYNPMWPHTSGNIYRVRIEGSIRSVSNQAVLGSNQRLKTVSQKLLYLIWNNLCCGMMWTIWYSLTRTIIFIATFNKKQSKTFVKLEVAFQNCSLHQLAKRINNVGAKYQNWFLSTYMLSFFLILLLC